MVGLELVAGYLVAWEPVPSRARAKSRCGGCADVGLGADQDQDRVVRTVEYAKDADLAMSCRARPRFLWVCSADSELCGRRVGYLVMAQVVWQSALYG